MQWRPRLLYWVGGWGGFRTTLLFCPPGASDVRSRPPFPSLPPHLAVEIPRKAKDVNLIKGCLRGPEWPCAGPGSSGEAAFCPFQGGVEKQTPISRKHEVSYLSACSAQKLSINRQNPLRHSLSLRLRVSPPHIYVALSLCHGLMAASSELLANRGCNRSAFWVCDLLDGDEQFQILRETLESCF